MASSIDADNIFAKELAIEDFFCNFWRRKPVFIRNGAKGFVPHPLAEPTFDEAVSRMRATAARHVKEREREVVFVEKISDHLPDLARRAAHLAATFGTPGAWFDGVRTHGASGIGSHFDHSDNFVLQQSGTKVWTLAPPGVLDRAEIARRMLGVPGVGAAPISSDRAVTYTLGPGDLLYIPLCWVHSGVSHGASLSLSLVCPAIPFQALLLRGLQQALTERLIGHQPAPAFPAHLEDADRDRQVKTVRQVARTLLARLSSDDMLDSLVDRQLALVAPVSPVPPEPRPGMAAA